MQEEAESAMKNSLASITTVATRATHGSTERAVNEREQSLS